MKPPHSPSPSPRARILLAITHLIFAVLCFVLYRKMHVPLVYVGLTIVLSLGFYVRRWRGVVLAFVALVAVLLWGYFFAAKLLGNHNPFKLIPDLVAILADTNQAEILAGVANLGSKYEFLSLLFLLSAVALFVLARRHGPQWARRGRPAPVPPSVPVQQQKGAVPTAEAERAGAPLFPAAWWTVGLGVVSAGAMAALAVAPDFVLHKVAAGIQDVRQVYAENRDRIQARAAFTWQAQARHVGEDTVVLVLGETARGDRFGINGYHRDTTPLLAQQEGVISYTDAISNGAFTLQSTPIILTRSRGELQGRLVPEKSLISAFKEAGYETWYISYLDSLHGGDSAINQIVAEADHTIRTQTPKGELMDIAGLDEVKAVMADPAPRKLIVFKMIGSHFNFQDRYDDRFEVFTPSYRQVTYTSPTPADKPILDNTYDNTILKTDAVLSGILDALREVPGRASLTFISDHGTAIFDDGHSLYGGDTPANFDVPLIFWLKPGYYEDARPEHLKANQHRPVDSTCVLDTLFTIADIDTPLEKGCDLAAGPVAPFARQVILGNRIVDFDAHFGRAGE